MCPRPIKLIEEGDEDDEDDEDERDNAALVVKVPVSSASVGSGWNGKPKSASLERWNWFSWWACFKVKQIRE